MTQDSAPLLVLKCIHGCGEKTPTSEGSMGLALLMCPTCGCDCEVSATPQETPT